MKIRETNNYFDSTNLGDYKILATDGEIGKVVDFYFDESLFVLRYFIVDTASFLGRDRVLVSPISLKYFSAEEKKIWLNISKEELKNSPAFDSQMTISRRYEVSYNNYFSWPSYWATNKATIWSLGPYGVPWVNEDLLEKNKRVDYDDSVETDLRSAGEVMKYGIKGLENEFGHIQGFLIDANTYQIDFYILDTINYFPSKNVLARVEWTDQISYLDQVIEFPFSEELIKGAPNYDKDKNLDDLIKKTDSYFISEFTNVPKGRVFDTQPSAKMTINI